MERTSKNKILTTLAISSLSILISKNSFSEPTIPVDVMLTFGGFYANKGLAQDINIQSLIGNQYTLTNNKDSNVLVGVGLFKDINRPLSVGINTFYLLPTKVQGLIYQEHLFDNLSYQYSVSHVPIMFTAKALIPSISDKYKFSMDVGIGPNIMHTNSYVETSRDGGVTIPDNSFLTKTQATFASSVGIGVVLNNFIGTKPLEVAYRFFYLGNGKFNYNDTQILNSLETGSKYANSVTVSLKV
ncbi:MAG: hypothetical protein P1U74_04785 [Legionellaceae bacterium]|nr:hypothetical protein [Legionellaceae bacterium]